MRELDSKLIASAFKYCAINISFGEKTLINKKLFDLNEIRKYFEELDAEDLSNLDGINEILTKQLR